MYIYIYTYSQGYPPNHLKLVHFRIGIDASMGYLMVPPFVGTPPYLYLVGGFNPSEKY